MSRTLISVGTGMASFAGSVLLTFGARDLLGIPVAGIAATALGIVARNSCLENNESLNKRDLIMIGGAGLVGTMSGGATVLAIGAIFQSVLIANMVGSMMGSIMGSIVTFPLTILSSLTGRHVIENHYHIINQ